MEEAEEEEVEVVSQEQAEVSSEELPKQSIKRRKKDHAAETSEGSQLISYLKERREERRETRSRDKMDGVEEFFYK